MAQKNQSGLSKKKAQDRFRKKLGYLSATASLVSSSKSFDLDVESGKAIETFEALGANGALQEMLVAQMLSIHELQQIAVTRAHGSNFDKSKEYHVNSAVKLSNCFTQQAALLARLQGGASQKITVERVDIHQGGQAIVGNVTGAASGVGGEK